MGERVPSGCDDSVTNRLATFMKALRLIATILLGATEDFLDIPYDRSALAKRQHEERERIVG